MLTYLDESYSNDKLMVGTLFITSDSEKKFLHKGLRDIKIKENFVDKNGNLKEIKYSKIKSKKTLRIAEESVNLFLNAYQSFFRVGIIKYSDKDLLNMRGTKDNNIKKAIIYTQAVVLLVKNNYISKKITEGTLLMDNLTRCKGDLFNQIINKKLIKGTKLLKHVSYVDSSSAANHTIQICDLLLGGIRNTLIPCKTNKFKNDFGKYIETTLKLPKLNYWKNKRQGAVEAKYPKCNIRFYGVPNCYK